MHGSKPLWPHRCPVHVHTCVLLCRPLCTPKCGSPCCKPAYTRRRVPTLPNDHPRASGVGVSRWCPLLHGAAATLWMRLCMRMSWDQALRTSVQGRCAARSPLSCWAWWQSALPRCPPAWCHLLPSVGRAWGPLAGVTQTSCRAVGTLDAGALIRASCCAFGSSPSPGAWPLTL